ncbi:cell division control protein-like protein, partial [Aureobasidium melanogenum]
MSEPLGVTSLNHSQTVGSASTKVSALETEKTDSPLVIFSASTSWRINNVWEAYLEAGRAAIQRSRTQQGLVDTLARTARTRTNGGVLHTKERRYIDPDLNRQPSSFESTSTFRRLPIPAGFGPNHRPTRRQGKSCEQLPGTAVVLIKHMNFLGLRETAHGTRAVDKAWSLCSTTSAKSKSRIRVAGDYDVGESLVETKGASDGGRSDTSRHAVGAKLRHLMNRVERSTTQITCCSSLETLVLKGPAGDVESGLEQLRYTVLSDGIASNSDGMSELRIYIWLILLNVPPLRTDAYLDLVRQGASPAYTKIRNDTFRTLTTDPLFRRRVTENSLTRVLNAIAWKLHDAHEARVNGWMSPPTLSVPRSIDGQSDQVTSPTSRHRASITGTEGSEAGDGASHVGYVQGMNVMAAPFLYAARSEAEAFAAFDRFITVECPGYVRGSMDGVHRGLALVDKILAIVDPKLSAYLASKGMEARIYAFASVLTMCACTPPLPEVLQLWDFCFAYGPHLNLLCIVAQLVLIRDQLLTSPSPNQILRSFPPLQASKIKPMAISFVRKLPDDLYQQIVDHAK